MHSRAIFHVSYEFLFVIVILIFKFKQKFMKNKSNFPKSIPVTREISISCNIPTFFISSSRIESIISQISFSNNLIENWKLVSFQDSNRVIHN